VKKIGTVITNQVCDSTGKIRVYSRAYDVQAIIHLGGEPAYVTTKVFEKRLDGSIEYLVIANPLVKDYIPINESAISISHYELECGCKPTSDNHVNADICPACKKRLQTMYPEIPFEGEGL